MTYEPRAAANAILDEAQRRGLSLTHLSLQKLVDFAHGCHLVILQEDEDGGPLEDAPFA